MPEIVVYTTDMCPYCYRAKRLLDQKGVAYTEIDVTLDPAKRAEMAQKSGGVRTVPQIFIGGRHVGGSDELYALEAEGKLDPLLAA
ncbi:glutaredoxin 3 [Desertibaculum subflavum]|uniref:glutaredoxin 3 n=1 Tax=Desertibaculum subflavum TaxID=2268458 RepID=UPI000E6721CD